MVLCSVPCLQQNEKVLNRKLLQQDDQQGDGEHREQRRDEGHLGYECGVATVAQAEDGAVGGYGHGDDQRVDVHHKGVEAHEAHQIMYTHRQQYQS